MPPDKNISYARLSLILVSKTVTSSKFMSTDTLALSLTMNLFGDLTLLAHAKQYRKPVPVVTDQTLRRHFLAETI